MPYSYAYEKLRKYRARRRMKALRKIANGDAPVCAICGCPHLETLQIGHPNGDGGDHRKELRVSNSRKMVGWVLDTPIEELRQRVQLECAYCNAYHQKFREYPPLEKRPKWP